MEMAPPAGTADKTLTVQIKAPIRSRPSDRLVHISGGKPGRHICDKALSQSHEKGQTRLTPGILPL